MDVLLANPRGFCAGVDRAIAIVEQALAQFGAPIYVRHEVVHNKFVVDDLKAKGAVFVDELAEVPAGGTVVFSAHGVSKTVRAEAAARGLTVFDATCPLVTKVHVEVAKMREHGREIVMIGHRGHPEVEGTMGQCADGIQLVESVGDVDGLVVADPDNLAYVTQTTLSVDDAAAIVAALRRRFPRIVGPKKDDICYATQNRQDAVKFMAPQVDVVIVVGSPNSSNSNRLREVAANRGIAAYMVDRADQLEARWIEGKARVGVTAGASAPEVLVREVIARLRELGAGSVRELVGAPETIVFPLAERVAARARVGGEDLTLPGVAERAEKRHEGRRREQARAGRDDAVAARLGERTHEPLGTIERQEQRRPLPRAYASCDEAGQEQGKRQRLQREPGSTRPQRRKHRLPEHEEHRERDGERHDGALSGHNRRTSDDRREVVELEAGTLLDELQEDGEARVGATLERDALLDLERAGGHENLRRRRLGARHGAIFGQHDDGREAARDGVLVRGGRRLGAVGQELAAELEPAALERVAEPPHHRDLQSGAALDRATRSDRRCGARSGLGSIWRSA